MKPTLQPYLNFDGNAREAMTYYHSILGGNLTIQTFGEAFPDTPPQLMNRTMHAQLDNDALTFMASDTHPQYSEPFVAGNNVSLCILGSDNELLTGYFNKLAEGGKITMPLEKQFWGDVFGQLTDKFGIQWMVNVTSA